MIPSGHRACQSTGAAPGSDIVKTWSVPYFYHRTRFYGQSCDTVGPVRALDGEFINYVRRMIEKDDEV